MADVAFRYGPAETGETQPELVDGDEVLETFDVHPSLSELREAQRENAPRLSGL